MTNYLTASEVKTIVHLAGTQIRLFLGNSDAKDFKGEAQRAITAFHYRPASFTDEELLEKGANVDNAHEYTVRIELRGDKAGGKVAQVVAKGVWGHPRQTALAALRKELERYDHALSLRTAGSSSFEFNRAGVDKALPVRYLQARWPQVLDQMKYVPGPRIDARRRRTVIAADGDGTIYDGPRATHLPTLQDGPVFAPMMDYVQAGGIFMLISGNDLNRSFKRLIAGIPRGLYPRILIAANGGADLACAGTNGKPVFINDYRNEAIGAAAKYQEFPALDIVYIGDDSSPNGNDRPAFEAVGKERAVLVHSLAETASFLEKWTHDQKIHTA